MKKPGPLHALWKRHAEEEADLLRSALADTGWRLLPAAEALAVTISTLQRVIRRHPELVRERDRRYPPEKRHGGRPMGS